MMTGRDSHLHYWGWSSGAYVVLLGSLQAWSACRREMGKSMGSVLGVWE
jgi:hypothetical protein